MAELDAQISDNASRVEKVKEKVQDTARDVERLRVERAAKEEEVRQTKGEEEDARVMGLYDWCVLHAPSVKPTLTGLWQVFRFSRSPPFFILPGSHKDHRRE